MGKENPRSEIRNPKHIQMTGARNPTCGDRSGHLNFGVRNCFGFRASDLGFPRRGSRGFTLLELILTVAILAIFTAGAVPIARNALKREKEIELRRGLRELRTAIDRYKRAFDAGLINRLDVRPESEGYPPSLEVLVEGVQLAGSADRKLRFLRRIPVDPITGKAEWGLRSTQDEPDSTAWGGQNIFDVYSLSEGMALDGTKYREW
jgi:general secretion pathway protein G